MKETYLGNLFLCESEPIKVAHRDQTYPQYISVKIKQKREKTELLDEIYKYIIKFNHTKTVCTSNDSIWRGCMLELIILAACAVWHRNNISKLNQHKSFTLTFSATKASTRKRFHNSSSYLEIQSSLLWISSR